MILTDSDLKWIKTNECDEKTIQRYFSDGLHHSYRDGGCGKWTIYYGLTYDLDNLAVNKSTVWTDEYANRAFIKACESAVNKVNKLCERDKIKLTQGQFCALVDFQFNTGVLPSSTLWKVIANHGSETEIERQFMRWVYDNKVVIQGLKNRRIKEVQKWKQK